MAATVILPKQGWSMEEATFVAWLKADGQAVKTGEPLFSVETDKAVQEIEALDSGLLHIPPNGPRGGDVIKIGDTIGYLLQPGESAPTGGSPEARPPAADPARPVEGADAARSRQSCASSSSVQSVVSTAALRVSPRAAGRAVAAGVDLRTVTGTGRDGRIRESDVIAAAGRPPPPPPSSSAPVAAGPAVRGLRRTIAERMVHSKTVTAPVTLTTRVDASALVALRAAWKAQSRTPMPGFHDVLITLAAEALREHPALNARWEDDRIVQPDTVNIGLAVDTPEGLLVPVVRDVPALTLEQVAARTAELVSRARERKLSAAELSGGTFTITNLGGMGVDAFTPIINWPECAVLGVGRITREPVADGEKVVVGDRLWLSLTFDHRIVDGAPAARFLEALRGKIERCERCG